MNSNTYRKYKQLKVEDFIWTLYFLILIGNLYSNHLQEDNYTKKKYTDPKYISKINTTILVSVFLIYLYFTYRSYQDFKYSYNTHDSPRKQELNAIVLFASILFLIGGALFIYVERNSIGDDEIGII